MLWLQNPASDPRAAGSVATVQRYVRRDPRLVGGLACSWSTSTAFSPGSGGSGSVTTPKRDLTSDRL